VKKNPLPVPGGGRRRSQCHWLILLLGLLLSAEGRPAVLSIQPAAVDEQTVHQAQQITAETDPVGDIAVSSDGRWLVHTVERNHHTDLWLRSADPSVVTLPRLLNREPIRAASPAISSDGRMVAYVDTSRDVKGDIFLMDVRDDSDPPRRLTGDATEDGGPCFSADGKRLYFHQAKPGERHQVAVIERDALRDTPQQALPAVRALPITGAFPSVSPDGGEIAFVSYETATRAAIYIHHLSSGKTRPLTRGDHLDVSPVWSGDGRRVIFARRDRYRVNDMAVSVLYEKEAMDAAAAYPLTAGGFSARRPRTGGGRLFFLSSRGGISNCWSLPESGEVPAAADASTQMRLAHRIADKVPADAYLSVLGYARVMARFARRSDIAAAAAYHMGRGYQAMNLTADARSAFQTVVSIYRNQIRASALAAIQLARLDLEEQLSTPVGESRRRMLIDASIQRIQEFTQTTDAVVQARAAIESARLREAFESRPDRLMEAVTWLETAVQQSGEHRRLAAEAAVLKGDIYGRLAPPQNVYPLYLTVLKEYPDAEEWVQTAVARVLDLSLADAGPRVSADRVRLLRRIARENRDNYPSLAIGALNRIGDLYFETDEWSRAKGAYHEVLERFPFASRQTAAARLALAEILYREERFRAALDLYETELGARNRSDHIYQLARSGYIRKSVAAGEYLFNIGEVLSARSTFKELIRYDAAIVEGHRGNIKCAAALGRIASTTAEYSARLTQHPNDPLAMYTLALCLTYSSREADLLTAEKLLQKAIRLDGRSEYYHQTLGFVQEVLETVYGHAGKLEPALAAYRKARFLNDPRSNPANAAHLTLNLGNLYYVLGRYQKAFEHYIRRMDSPIAFGSMETEILFYRRLGAAGFQINAPAQTITAFQKALDLMDQHTDPYQAAMIFDRLHRYLMDRILTPAGRQPESAEQARRLALAQSGIHQRLSAVSRQVFPPPAPEWAVYRQKVTALLQEQQTAAQAVFDMMPAIDGLDVSVADARQTLASLSQKIRQALSAPDRLLALKAETMDRLGLAYQEAGQWQAAAAAFQEVYRFNQQSDRWSNLSRNRRSVAYNTYRMAEDRSGAARRSLLDDAAAGFQEVIELVDRHGVPEKAPSEEKDGALIRLRMAVSLDRQSATQALYGFTAQQEKRLAEAFLFRINLERGRYEDARAALAEQLSNYPPDAVVAIEDRFGVSLLYHQAGLLAAAMGNWTRAFDHFKEAARLSYTLENAVSTALNVRNMACAVGRVPISHDRHAAIRQTLMKMDRLATRLLADHPPPDRGFTAAAYHNAMGVYCLPTGARPAVDAAAAVHQADQAAAAGIHFRRGIRLLDGASTPGDRRFRQLTAVLQLNMAALAQTLDQEKTAAGHLETALAIARDALLPELEWRALAGLGRHEAALDILEEVTVFRAGCRPLEIMQSFAAMVENKITLGRREQAFNLMERLSELERFNRMAFLLQRMPDSEKRLYRDVCPRLMRMEDLMQRRAAADGAEAAYLKDSLDRERRLLRQQLGRDDSRLSPLVQGIQDAALRRQTMLLLGLAQQAEEAADRGDRDLYAERITRYLERRAQLTAAGGDSVPAALFGPVPAAAVDVAAHLSPNGVLWRLFPLPLPQDGWCVFELTPDQMSVSRFASPADVQDYLKGKAPKAAAEAYWAAEEPFWLPGLPQLARGLSGTHVVRSIAGRKPFKRELLLMPPSEAAPAGFNRRGRDEHRSDARTSPAGAGVHTWVLSHPVASTLTVPTRAGENAHEAITAQPADAPRLDLAAMLPHFRHLSLAVLPHAAAADAYLIGHLFALYGCASVVLSSPSGPHDDFTASFLHHYAESSVLAALQQTMTASMPDPPFVLLGHRGMSPEETSVMARRRFAAYVKEGRRLLEDAHPRDALPYFEDALQIARETAPLQKYLPGLYQFARESAYQSDELDTAARYAARLVERIQKDAPDSEAHARALTALGLIQARREAFADAIPLLEEAVDILAFLSAGDRQISALADLGIVLENATEYDRALKVFHHAASLSRTLDRTAVLADQYANIARINDLRLSRYAAAIEYFEKALDLYQRTDARPKVAQTLLDIGRCRRLLGDFPAAEKKYAAAMVQAEGLDAPLLKVKILLEQANNAWFQADYQKAFARQRLAHRLSQEHELSLMRIMAENTAGLFWWTLGDNEKALQTLEDTLATARRLNIRQDEIATTLNNLGIVLRELGRFEEALTVFDEALAIDRRLKSSWAVAYDLRNKALTLLKMQQAATAVDLFRESARIAHAIGNRINEAKALLGLGQALAQSGQTAPAKQAYQEALGPARRMSLKETAWRAVYGLAQLELEAHPPAAEALLREAVDIIEGMRAEIKIEQLRDRFVDNKLSVYATLVTLLVNQGKITAAFEVAERSRARNFIDLLGNQRLSLSRAVDQQLYDRMRELRRRIEEQGALLARAEAPAERDAYQAALDALNRELNDVMLDIQAANPQLSTLVTVMPVRAADLLDRIEPGVALISYYLLPTEMFCWVVRPGGLYFHRIPVDRERLGRIILDYRRALQNLEPYTAVSQQLFGYLIEPLLGHLTDAVTLGVIPHGPLHYLSFATLTADAGTMADRFAFFYLPSASVLDYTLQRRREKDPEMRVLAVGNPQLGDPLYDLPFAEHEVNAIKWRFPRIDILTRDKATEDWIVDNIDQYEIIHLASHGEFDPVNPLFSAIKLAKGPQMDGDLDAADVFGLDIHADMVFLSACQTGLGRVTGGDDVIGLNRAFLYAGTHTVVSSLWRVSDVSTAVLIKQFYRRYVTDNKSQALRRAMLHVRTLYPHPGYWGAFTLVGDYK